MLTFNDISINKMFHIFWLVLILGSYILISLWDLIFLTLANTIHKDKNEVYFNSLFINILDL